MKGLFPTAHFGAQQLNASNNNRSNNRNTHRHNNTTTTKEDLPTLCSRCAEPVDISLKPSSLALSINFASLTLMLLTARLVTKLQSQWESFAAWNTANTTIVLSIALFIACTMCHITVAHRTLDMSVSRMLFWTTNLGGFAGGLGFVWCTIIRSSHLRSVRWLVATNCVMWGCFAALFAVELFRLVISGKKRGIQVR